MSEDTTVETETKARKPRTKKVAEESAVVENVVIEQADNTVVNEEGQKVISGPQKSRAPRKSNVHTKEDGAIGSHAADRALEKNKVKNIDLNKKEDIEKIAVWSSKNIRWTGIGELSKGYNIVTKEAAEKWLDRAGIREATPEEIATYYGK